MIAAGAMAWGARATTARRARVVMLAAILGVVATRIMRNMAVVMRRGARAVTVVMVRRMLVQGTNTTVSKVVVWGGPGEQEQWPGEWEQDGRTHPMEHAHEEIG